MTQDFPSVAVRYEGKAGIVTVGRALSVDTRLALLNAVHSLDLDEEIDAIVITGAKGVFLPELQVDEADPSRDEPSVASVAAEIEAARKPVLAAINGPVLDGALAIALACDLRLAAPNAAVGLPAIRLGLIPEGGVIHRLSTLLGVAATIEIVGAARNLTSADAVAAGIFDQVVQNDVVGAAITKALDTSKRRIAERSTPAADPVLEAEVEATALKRNRGLPSVVAAVALARQVAVTTFEEAMVDERDAALQMRATPESKALGYLAASERLTEAAISGSPEPRSVRRVAVIGAGTMGSGIAVCLADAGLDVDLLEQSAEAAATGSARVDDIYGSRVKSGRLAEAAAAGRLARIRVSDDWSAVASADLVIEAAFEDMAVKTSIFRRLDELARPGTVLATNTSYLDVMAIAEITKRPAEVLGLHFFSPAHVMRLLEVVRTDRTAPDVLATGLALGRRIGKLPIVARNSDGFIGNRIFAVYRRHAEYLLEDGASPREIDEALVAYGFAMGPFAVSDMSGLDIAWAMRRRRAATRDRGERYVAIPDRLCEAGRLGRKSGRGWYDYQSGKPQPAPEVDAIIAEERARRDSPTSKFAPEQIQRRILAVMANEGARVLQEGVSLRPSDIDLAFVNGYGFPRLKGGPMFAADRQGLTSVLAEVEEAARVGGAGSEPAPLLVRLANEGSSFAAWQAGPSGDADLSRN